MDTTQYAAGVLLLSWHNNILYALLGKDQYDCYSDFGGKCDSKDGGYHARTAARECYEETCSTVNDFHETMRILSGCEYVISKSYTNKNYYMYISFTKYNPCVQQSFSVIRNTISELSHMYQFKEKTELKWFKLQDVMNGNIELRNVFHKTLQQHYQTILKIAYNNKITYTSHING